MFSEKCILCLKELSQREKPEHILLNALGGRKTSTRVLCSACNGEMGRGPDKEFADSVAWLRNIANFSSGDGKPPPIVRNIAANGLSFNLEPGAMPVANSGRALTFKETPDGRLIVGVNARSPSELKALVPQIAKRVGQSEEAVWQKLTAAGGKVLYQPAPTASLQVSFGTEGSQRSMAKACLSLWASKVGSAEVCHSRYDQVRNFIVGRVNEAEERFIWADSRPLPENGYGGQFGPFPNMIWVESNEQGTVLGYFRLYGLTSWVFLLCQSGAPSLTAVGLVSNPDTPSQWCDDIVRYRWLSHSWLASRPENSDINELSAQVNKFRRWAYEKSKERAINEIYSEALHMFGYSEDDPLTPEQAEMLSRYISQRVSLTLLNMPHEMPLNEAIWRTYGGSKLQSDD